MLRRSPLAFLLIAVLTLPLGAQRRNLDLSLGRPSTYSGKFALARLRYARFPGWSYDWPEMEHNLGAVLDAISSMRVAGDGRYLFSMNDPDLFKFPVSYLSEPGYWYPSDEDAAMLRDYLAKGGFLIVDDFHFDNEWAVFDRAIHQVLPDAKIDRLTISHPIFNCFFKIKSLDVPYPGRLGEMGLMGEFYGIYENNDPEKRLKVVIDYNIDIGDYMEWSDTNAYAVAPTNEAYKFFINYLIYGLTH